MNTVLQGQPSMSRDVVGLFGLAAAFTAFWLGLNVMLPGLQATGIPSVFIRLAIHTTMLTGLWLGLARTDFNAGTRVMVWLAFAVPFTAWLAVVWWLAVDGAFALRCRGIIWCQPWRSERVGNRSRRGPHARWARIRRAEGRALRCRQRKVRSSRQLGTTRAHACDLQHEVRLRSYEGFEPVNRWYSDLHRVCECHSRLLQWSISVANYTSVKIAAWCSCLMRRVPIGQIAVVYLTFRPTGSGFHWPDEEPGSRRVIPADGQQPGSWQRRSSWFLAGQDGQPLETQGRQVHPSPSIPLK